MKRSNQPRRKLERFIALGDQSFSFDKPVQLDIPHSCLEYLAMQNYALRLGSFRSLNWMSIGFRVMNGEELYQLLNVQGFYDVMTDVGEVILEALALSKAMISYTGSGAFVVLVPRFPGLDMEEVLERLKLEVSELNRDYGSVEQMKVRLGISAPIYNGLFSQLNATALLERAIAETFPPKHLVGWGSTDMAETLYEGHNKLTEGGW